MKQATGTGAAEVQANFDHLVEPGGGLQPEQPGPSDAEGNSTPPGAVRLQPHVIVAAVQSRKPVELRQLLKHRAHGTDCQVEVLTLDGAVLWDYERYEVAMESGLEVRPIPVPGDDPKVRLCLDALHAVQISAGIRALVAVVLCEWVPSGRPKKVTQDGTFHGKRWTNQEMADLAGVGATSISEAKSLCAFGLETRVLKREFEFGAAVNRVRLVKAAGLSQLVRSGELRFDQAYERALVETERVGAIVEDPAEPASWQEEKEALQKRIRELTAENARVKADLQEAERELDEARALRVVIEETLRDVRLQMREAGVEG